MDRDRYNPFGRGQGDAADRHRGGYRHGARGPLRAALVAEETRGLVERRGIQFALKDDQAADGLGAGQLAAGDPVVAPGIAEDASAEGGVFRFGEGGAGDAVLSGSRVELAVVDGERGDAVGAVGRTAIDPFPGSRVAIDASGVRLARFAGAREQRAVVRRQRERKQRGAGSPAIRPVRDPVVVDAELEVTPVGLVRGHAGIALQREMKSAPLERVVLADQVARQDVRRIVRLHPQRDAEISRAEAGRFFRRDFQPRVAAPDHRGGPGGVPLHGAVDRGGLGAAAHGRLGVAGQRPMRDQVALQFDGGRILPQVAVEEGVGGLAFGGREAVAGIRVPRDEAVRGVEQRAVNGQRRVEAVAYARHLEVGDIVQRRVDEDGARREGGEHLGEVERNFRGIVAIHGLDARHVVAAAPRADVPVVVLGEHVEAAARYDRLHAFVEDGEEQGVVAAEGMADHPDASGVDVGEGGEQVDAAPVVDDALHRRADVVHRVRVGRIFRGVQQRVVEHEADVAARSELGRVGHAGTAGADPGGVVLAGSSAAREANHRGASVPRAGAVGHEQKAGQPVARLDGEGHVLPRVVSQPGLVEQLHVQRHGGGRREWSHHQLHVGANVGHAARPVGRSLHRLQLAGPVLVEEKIRPIRIRGRQGILGRKVRASEGDTQHCEQSPG